MKKQIVTGLMALLALVLVLPQDAGAQAGGSGIAFIDSQAIIDQWPAARQAMEAFQQEVIEAQGRVRTMEEELGRLQQELAEQQETLSQEEMQQRLADFQQRVVSYQQDVGRIEEEIEQAQQARVEELRDQITSVVEEVRAERNLAIVLDRSASGVVAADGALDLTDVILQRLR